MWVICIKESILRRKLRLHPEHCLNRKLFHSLIPHQSSHPTVIPQPYPHQSSQLKFYTVWMVFTMKWKFKQKLLWIPKTLPELIYQALRNENLLQTLVKCILFTVCRMTLAVQIAANQRDTLWKWNLLHEQQEYQLQDNKESSWRKVKQF